MNDLTFEEYQKFVQTLKPLVEGCPVLSTLELFQGKWSMHVLFELSKKDSIRFGELKKQLDGITNTMLTNTLRGLEENGLVTRVQFNEIPPHVEYSLSEAGKNVYPIFVEMAKWGQKYNGERLTK